MAKNRGLGRGLDALMGGVDQLPPAEPAEQGDVVRSIRLTDIDPNPSQPRRQFDEEALKDLAQSIRSVGVLQPILVARRGSRYTIIAGERRFRAARLADLTEIPAIVRDWDEVRRLEAALIENLQRDDLNPIDEAAGMRRLIEQCGLTQDAAAERLGKSRPAVANAMRLLTLAEPVQRLLRDGLLSAGHGRALVTLPRDAQLRLAQLAAEQGLSVRQLERLAAQQAAPPAEKPRPTPPSAEFKQLERMAREAFGTRAELTGDEARGKLTLHYKTPDELQRIWDALEGMSQSQL
ncbi:MAG: ParB/RepB/Spo0J family partition protein [Clostridiales bacterium]|nr:ParB/RepB/Spo0J family partition protein [Clostridiales bacterium]